MRTTLYPSLPGSGIANDTNAAVADGNVRPQSFQVNTDVDKKIEDSFQVNTKVEKKVEDSYLTGINNNVKVDEKGQAGLVNAKDNAQATVNGSNYKATEGGNAGPNAGATYIVDNAILANVNVAAEE